MRSACRERSQRSRTQQLQCATVSQHSMYSYVVESGRERCDQHPQAFLRLGGGTHKAHRVSQGRRMTVPVLRCHQKSVLARLWGGMSSCGLSIETIVTLDRFVLRSAPHVLRLGRKVSPRQFLNASGAERGSGWGPGGGGAMNCVRSPNHLNASVSFGLRACKLGLQNTGHQRS